MANNNCNPTCPTGVNKYTGLRYVPKFMGQWDNTREYEPLMIVQYQGNSYTSKTYVPIGALIANETYWAITGNYNAQVEQYRQEVEEVKNDLHLNDAKIINNENILNTSFINAKYPPLNSGLVGLAGDGVSNDAIKLQNMINYCISNKIPLFIPTGIYLLENKITINGQFSIFGSSESYTIFKSEAPICIEISVPSITGSYSIIHDIKLIGNNTNTGINIVSCHNLHCYNIWIDDFINGMIVNACRNSLFEFIKIVNSEEIESIALQFGNNSTSTIYNNITISQQNQHGIGILSNNTNWNDSNFKNTDINGCETGIKLTNNSSVWDTIFENTLLDNVKVGVKLENVGSGLQFIGGWIALAHLDTTPIGFHIKDSSGITVKDFQCLATNPVIDNTKHQYFVLDNSNFCRISSNYLVGGFYQMEIYGCYNCAIENNLMLSTGDTHTIQGIYAYSGSGQPCHSLIISGNIATGNINVGISLVNVTGSIVKDNIMKNSIINIEPTGDNIVKDNFSI